MKSKLLLTFLFITLPILAQVGIGTTTPNVGAILDVSSADKSLLITRVANTAAITNPTNGMIIYDIAQACVKVYQNGAWSDCITNNNGGGLNSLNCAGANVTGSIYQGIPVTNVSAIISYTGGNGGIYNGQTVNSTGVLGLTAVCGNGSFASGNGALIFTITGTATSSGVASFAITIGGQTCTLNITVLQAPVITSLNCAGATHNGTLTVNQSASGVSTIINYTGGNGGSYAGQTINSSGITGLTATLASGTLATGAGSLTFIITGTPSSSGTASFTFTLGGQTCTFTRSTGGTISSLNCAGATHTGTLNQGTAASGVSSTISYTGGTGGSYAGQIITSTGVTGLTATLAAGTFAVGSGSITLNITGTPTNGGIASFSIILGGQTCTFTRTVYFYTLDGCPSTYSCLSPDCNYFGNQYNTAGGGTTDGIMWDMSGMAQPSPGNNNSEGVQFNLSTTLFAGVTYYVEVKWIAFGYSSPLVAMGFSIKTGGCSGTVLTVSPAKTPICSGPSSTCETWQTTMLSFTPTTNINSLNFIAWGGNGGNDFILIDYIKFY